MCGTSRPRLIYAPNNSDSPRRILLGPNGVLFAGTNVDSTQPPEEENGRDMYTADCVSVRIREIAHAPGGFLFSYTYFSFSRVRTHAYTHARAHRAIVIVSHHRSITPKNTMGNTRKPSCVFERNV